MLRAWRRRRAAMAAKQREDARKYHENLSLGFIANEMEENDVEAHAAGSVMGRQTIDRARVEGDARLRQDYFINSPVYGARLFRRRFRMRRTLFIRILAGVERQDPYFVRRRDAAGKLGLSPYQKVTTAMRMLCYGVAADAVDEYIRIGASTATESLKRFVRAVCEVFGEEYLRSPTESDTTRLLAEGEQRGFPGMLGSIDCMHWGWKNCPSGWQGQYKGHVNEPTIILEAVASHDLWIWHAFFGLPGSLNDINVLHRSPLFGRLASGQAPEVHYTINGNYYTMGYYLADGIYPQWATFVKTIPAPQDNKSKHFAKMQEAARKDVERAFGVLQAPFAIVRGPARFWDQEDLGFIMTACIILYNMVVEDEGGNVCEDLDFECMGAPVEVSHGVPLWQFISTHESITNRNSHSQLQKDLMEHLWENFGQS